MSILMEHALPIANVLLEDFTTALPMLNPAEMTTEVMWGCSQRFALRRQSTLDTKLEMSMRVVSLVGLALAMEMEVGVGVCTL